jgi:hypothetical protein
VLGVRLEVVVRPKRFINASFMRSVHIFLYIVTHLVQLGLCWPVHSVHSAHTSFGEFAHFNF